MLRSYSAKQSAADLDSYFATLPGQGSHAVLPAKKKSRSVSNDGLPVLPKQDRAKKTRQQVFSPQFVPRFLSGYSKDYA